MCDAWCFENTPCFVIPCTLARNSKYEHSQKAAWNCHFTISYCSTVLENLCQLFLGNYSGNQSPAPQVNLFFLFVLPVETNPINAVGGKFDISSLELHAWVAKPSFTLLISSLCHWWKPIITTLAAIAIGRKQSMPCDERIELGRAQPFTIRAERVGPVKPCSYFMGCNVRVERAAYYSTIHRRGMAIVGRGYFEEAIHYTLRSLLWFWFDQKPFHRLL